MVGTETAPKDYWRTAIPAEPSGAAIPLPLPATFEADTLRPTLLLVGPICVPLGTKLLAGVLRREPLTAQDVDAQRDRLKVPRIHTSADATEVVEREPIGNRATK